MSVGQKDYLRNVGGKIAHIEFVNKTEALI